MMNDKSNAVPGSMRYSYWAVLVAILGSYLWVHMGLGLRYPMPWPDEGSLLWQAVSIQKHNTLFAPQLNPYRHVMWSPPGYMVVQGFIFKATGFSLEWARALSALYIMAGVAMLAAVFRRLHHPLPNLLFCAVFLHSPIIWLVGNLARMESLLFLVASVGLLALHRGRLYVGLAVIALLPLIHVNGFFFCLGAGVYFVVIGWRDRSKLRPSRLDLILIGLALIPWVLYLAYVHAHWEGFLHDMWYQVRFKLYVSEGIRGVLRRVMSPAFAVPGALIAGGLVYYTRVALPALFLLVYAAPLFLLSVALVGWPYDVYPVFMYLLVSVALLEVCTHHLAGILRLESDRSRRALAMVCCLAIAGFDYWAFRNEYLLSHTPTRSTVRQEGPAAVPYFARSDDEAIRQLLGSFESSGSVSVVFLPWADALLFHDMESENLRFVQPTFHEWHADVQIVHQSRYIPAWAAKRIRDQLVSEQDIHRELEQWDIIHSRDDTELWRYNRRVETPPSTSAHPK